MFLNMVVSASGYMLMIQLLRDSSRLLMVRSDSPALMTTPPSLGVSGVSGVSGASGGSWLPTRSSTIVLVFVFVIVVVFVSVFVIVGVIYAPLCVVLCCIVLCCIV
ncbi:MAG TPA: hypothetical protein PK309_07725 [Bacillota bacterium]|nr:hypothetical protein [Bacillota bacterium]